tara:strand:- start:26448 stop:26756 length:309 start_codon:yes stop_codon:yes gene_type:complete
MFENTYFLYYNTPELKGVFFMHYEIMQLSWSKRRPLDKEKKVLNLQVENFKKEINHFCTMIVEFEDETVTLKGRVTYNDIKHYWTICGINGGGNTLAIKLKD